MQLVGPSTTEGIADLRRSCFWWHKTKDLGPVGSGPILYIDPFLKLNGRMSFCMSLEYANTDNQTDFQFEDPGACLVHASLRDQSLSFLQTFSPKSAPVAGRRPSGLAPSNVESWIRHCFLNKIFLSSISSVER